MHTTPRAAHGLKALLALALFAALAASPALAQQPAAKPTPADGGKDVYDQLLHASCWLRCIGPDGNGKMGTGWVLDVKDRLIVTNWHVIDGFLDASVYFPVSTDGDVETDPDFYLTRVKPFVGRVIDSDRVRDLALLQVDSLPKGTRAVPLAAKSPKPGPQSRLHTCGGSTAGSDTLWVYNQGTVKQVGNLQMANGARIRGVESDIPYNHGNSGGAAVNDQGEVVAVVEGGWTEDERTGVAVRGVSKLVSVEEVRGYLDEALPLVSPKTADQFVKRGLRHTQEGRYDPAVKDFSEAIRLDGKSAAAYAARGWTFHYKGDDATALKDFDDALKIDRTFADAHKGKGVLARLQGKFDDSASELTDAIRQRPDDYLLYDERGVTYYQAGQFAEAVKDFGRAAELQPNDAQVLANRGDSLIQLGRPADAVADLARALELQPQRADFANLLGIALYRQGKYPDALNAFAAAVKADAKVAVYWANLGDTLVQLNQPADAVAAYSQAIRLNPADAALYQARGKALQAAGDEAAAQADFKKAAELDPAFATKARGKGR
jgi:tetratricopeptide (TPR) repeat protein